MRRDRALNALTLAVLLSPLAAIARGGESPAAPAAPGSAASAPAAAASGANAKKKAPRKKPARRIKAGPLPETPTQARGRKRARLLEKGEALGGGHQERLEESAEKKEAKADDKKIRTAGRLGADDK